MTTRSACDILTIGHSNLPADRFIALLAGAGVTAVADVRSSPYSRRMPHFSKGPLEAYLGHHEIAYVFLGRELGGRPASAALYDPEGWADYGLIRATPVFQHGLQRLVRGLDRHVIALMCGEEDPLDCHRGLMIAPALIEIGLPPDHIRKGGVIELASSLERRVLEAAGLGGMFRESLADAYRLMNQKKAFRLDRDVEEAGF